MNMIIINNENGTDFVFNYSDTIEPADLVPVFESLLKDMTYQDMENYLILPQVFLKKDFIKFMNVCFDFAQAIAKKFAAELAQSVGQKGEFIREIRY